MNNESAAEMFVTAIRTIATKEDNLCNLEYYLSCHFDAWLTKYASTPGDIAYEMKEFAEMQI